MKITKQFNSTSNIMIKSHPKSRFKHAKIGGTILNKGVSDDKPIVVLQILPMSDDHCIVEIIDKKDFKYSDI